MLQKEENQNSALVYICSQQRDHRPFMNLSKKKTSTIKPFQNQLFFQRVSFFYISPNQEQEQEPQLIESFQAPKIQQIQTFHQLKEISNGERDIKIKWSQFIKVKKEYYLHNYVLLKTTIGKGAFGVVQKVKSIYTEQIKAAKVIKKQNFQKQELEELHQEIKILKKIDHPHIIKLCEVYDNSKQIVLIMELCEGGQLFQCIKRKSLSETKTKHIMKQLLKALAYLHSQKIVHRDIKLQNMLYEDETKQSIKIIDFGLSTYCKQNQFLFGQCGTPIYMSPQIITSKYDFKCDIWAAGISMHILLTGRPPFIGENQIDLYSNILKKQLDYKSYKLSKISQNAKNILKSMLQKNPKDRPSAAQLLQNQYFKQEDIKQTKHTDLKRQAHKTQITTQLRTFRFQNKLQAIIQTFIAAQILTKQEKRILLQLFQKFDSNNDGVISTIQLQQALEKNKSISSERIDILMGAIDTNGSGEIDYTQFLAAGFDDCIQLKEERIRKIFNYFDSDLNGKISYDEVVEFLYNYQESQQQIQTAYKQFDKNGDGSISLQQFIELLLKKTSFIDQNKIKQKNKKILLYQRLNKKRTDNKIKNK